MPQKKEIVENSVILQRRYSRVQTPPPAEIRTVSPVQIVERQPSENYIQEHYSPKALRKKVFKSKSVDVPYTNNAQSYPPKIVNQTNSSFHSSVNASVLQKSSQEFNRKVQFLSVPNSAKNQHRRSKSPIQAVAKLFKKSDNTGSDIEKKSIVKIVKNIGSKLNNVTSIDSSSDEAVEIYRSKQGNLESKQFANTLKQTFRKLSHGYSSSKSNEKLNGDNLSDFERTKRSLLKSNALLNNSTEKFGASSLSPRPKENLGVANRDRSVTGALLVTRNIADCFRDSRKLKYSPPPESTSSRPVAATRKASGYAGVGGSSWFRSMFGSGLKLKERLVLAVSIGAVLFTLLLVVDLQLDLGMSGRYVLPSHGRVRYVSQDDGPGSAYNSFRKRFLQKTHR